MAENVWIVSKGSYSDYRVVAVFKTEAAAQAFASAATAADSSRFDDFQVEDNYVLYDEAPDVHIRHSISVGVDRDGTVSNRYEGTKPEWEPHACRVEVRQFDGTYGGPFMTVSATGCRKDEVEKAVRDRVDAYRTILHLSHLPQTGHGLAPRRAYNASAHASCSAGDAAEGRPVPPTLRQVPSVN